MPGKAPKTERDLIAIGASAGGVEALRQLVHALPADLPAAVLIVLHIMPRGPSLLDRILARDGRLPATQARDGEPLRRGHIYVARPGYHLQVRGSTIHLSSDMPENGHRPAIDSLFLSVAQERGPRAIGVVLTGTLDDGSEGLRMIKEHGGATVVQDPDDAAFPDMPRNAIDHVEPDRIVPLDRLGPTLGELLAAPKQSTLSRPPEPGAEEAFLLTCPACGGVLSAGEGTLHFACQAGHSYSAESLVAQQGAALESTLLHAMRTLEERATLLRRVAELPERRGSLEAEGRLRARAAKAADHADEIRGAIARLRGVEGDKPAAEEA